MKWKSKVAFMGFIGFYALYLIVKYTHLPTVSEVEREAVWIVANIFLCTALIVYEEKE